MEIAPPDSIQEPRADDPQLPTNASRPRVSVLMPVYNGEKYVAEAIDSILAQTFEDFEFLIINDGSTDGTREILERYAAQDGRIRVLHRENRGITPTLNELLELARGDLAARMDSDDIAFPDRFAQQVRHFDENPDCVLVGGAVVIIDPKGRELHSRTAPLLHHEIVDGFLGRKGHPLCHPATMFRRGRAIESGGYREGYIHAEDLDFFLRLAEVGKLANLAAPLLKYREHGGKVSAKFARLQGETTRRILMEAHQRRGTEPPTSVLDLRIEPITPADQRRLWGWWALGAGHVATARGHAFASLWRWPFSLETWRLVACAIRGR